MSRPDDHLPLTPLSMAILLAVCDDALHGYAIRQRLEEHGSAGVPLGTSSLYAALHRLAEDGLIEEVEDRDARRRSYGATRLGREVARAEALRSARVAGRALEQCLVTGTEISAAVGVG